MEACSRLKKSGSIRPLHVKYLKYRTVVTLHKYLHGGPCICMTLQDLLYGEQELPIGRFRSSAKALLRTVYYYSHSHNSIACFPNIESYTSCFITHSYLEAEMSFPPSPVDTIGVPLETGDWRRWLMHRRLERHRLPRSRRLVTDGFLRETRS